MRTVLSQSAIKLNKKHTRKKWWRITVETLALIVVFCTTYILILPAITMNDQPICGFEEHVHVQECQSEVEPCLMQEHIHTDACYSDKTEPQDGLVYLCASSEHTHSQECMDDEGTCVCTVPEHTHDISCLVAELDLTADVETQFLWEQTVSDIALTGNRPIDVLAVAQSQLGYTESQKNLILEEGELRGYTRYGEWYGEPYGEWNSIFAAFVVNYAGAAEIPVNTDAESWISELDASGYFVTKETHTVRPGDLVFTEGEGKRVGFAVQIEANTVKVIEGDVNDKVDYVAYDVDDPAIIGYGLIPAGDTIILEHKGIDYKVKVTFGKEAGIPETALLDVREIPRDSEEYNTYYQQSLDALTKTDDSSVTAPEVSFARFFDISFLVDGAVVEPTDSVDIRISYDESFSVSEDENGMVVHFADDGTEVFEANTNNDETELADTFEFTQSSFSVSGTLVVAETRAATNTANKVNFDTLDGTGSTEYIIYTQIGNAYYALSAPASGKKGAMVALTVSNDGTITWSGNAAVRWTFVETAKDTYDITCENGRYLHAFYNGNGSDIGVIGTNSKGATLVPKGTGANKTFTVKHPSSNTFVGDTQKNDYFQAVTDDRRAVNFYIAALPVSTYHVWFDGTNGGMMSYYGADNSYLAVDSADNTITLPTTWKSSTKYEYKLNGWYDIKTSTYYKPGDRVTIDQNTVFYADWVAATYDVGQDNEHVVDSIDTNNFITTHVFDYNVLFNVLSLTHTGTVTASGHSETWTIVNNGTVPYNNSKSLGFVFIDYDSGGEFSYPLGTDNTNINQSTITTGILEEVLRASDQNLIDLLFDPSVDVIGKTYVGEGNHLFQYMDSTTENYDGEHDGYYYLDARLNAASYNQTLQRFYLYDYLERTSDSDKDKGVGQYSDILPFNSPYIFGEDDDYTGDNNRRVDYYVDTVLRPGWEYDAKDGQSSFQEYNSVGDAATNYFFGLRTDIEFFLPNDGGSTDEYGNYGNISTRGEHMIFDFHGDDDVWVFIDGELVLDIGGMHGVMFGQIDFSTGTVVAGKDGGDTVTQSFEQILGHNITEGTHTMSIYYMERGSSQSNCAIYFNIAPRYDLEITKEDIVSAGFLNGAVFTVYNDEAMTSPAQLWDSEEAYRQDMADGSVDDTKSTFTVVNGVAKCWGISAGKTYYIYETTPPHGYPESDDMIRITLNNRGTATIETTTLHGSNGVVTEGYAVIKQNINETLKIVALTVTNQEEGDHTEVRVEKTWAEGSDNLPQSITVYLTADGVPVGRRAILNEGNGWSYTWTGLDKYRAEGIDQEIVYEVQEVLVPGFITTQGETKKVIDYVDWIRVDQMSDSKTYILVHNGQALTYTSRGFGWIDPVEAELDESLSAQWNVTTDHDGFHLRNGLGYTLTYGANGFYGTDSDAVNLNQVFYYLNSRLVVHDHDTYYQFGTNGSVVAEDGLAFTLYQKEVMTGFLTNIINVPVEEEDQTYVEVNKIWSDGNEKHTAGAVIVRLYADGKDTGRYITLNSSNNWAGGFYQLPYYSDDGTNVVIYTVKEDVVHGYETEYSSPAILPGLEIKIWQEVNGLTANSIYRFTSGTHALAVDSKNNVISALSTSGDTYQQWKAVARNNVIVLQNVGSGRYLQLSNYGLYTVSGASSATSVTVSNGLVVMNRRYLEISSNHVGVTSNTANITNQRIYCYVTINGRNGTGYTVTNHYGSYTLPKTGGTGTLPVTLGGLLLTAVPLMYMIGRKRQRGGKRGSFY